jgi:hypothetical protein
MRFAAYTAECIRDGQYDDGQELYPPGSGVYREITRAAVDRAMGLLADRGMAQKTSGRWHAITPGRMAPATLRAIRVLLASRDDLPPALAAELDAWKATLHTLTPPGVLARHAASQSAITPARPARAIAAG